MTVRSILAALAASLFCWAGVWLIAEGRAPGGGGMTVNWSRPLTADEENPAGKRWCVACSTRWRGADVCFSCDQPGVLATSPPEGWPSVERPVEAVEPRRTAT